MNKTLFTSLLSITILTSVVAISDISPAFADPILNPETGHYYEYITVPGLTWTDANHEAQTSTYNGLQGHLVTITSARGNEFVDNLVSDYSRNRAWIGLSDTVTEGTF